MTAWRWLLFGLGWRQPQIVLLDHGLYVDLPDSLRQSYCALWCSFLVNDMKTAVEVSQQIAGTHMLFCLLGKPSVIFNDAHNHERLADYRFLLSKSIFIDYCHRRLRMSGRY